MTPQEDDRDDPLADLLASANDCPPDPDLLARLRDKSTAVFLAAGEPPITPARRSAMAPILLRLMTGAVAAALLVAVGVRAWRSEPEAPAPLARALDSVADAESLHLKLTKGDRTSEIWVAKGNRLRWEESDERYQIAQGPYTYSIDESANRVTRGTADYFRPDRSGINLFALLGVPAPTPESIRAAQPVLTKKRDHGLYTLNVSGRSGEALTVWAEVVSETGTLREISVLTGPPDQLTLIAALTLVAVGQPVAEEKFQVKPTLSEDGRIGKIADVQGVVRIRPVGRERWTPVRPHLLLRPGDWVQADVRGANAATLKLLPGTSLIVGPGGLIEVAKPAQVRLHEGEIEIAPAKGTTIELTGPGTSKELVKERTHFRVQNEQLVRVPKEPLWLKGYKGQTANESIGSLVAKVDGRNVPLSVGYHKVSVEIRDQIARTTIEESFVNHTDAQLEGVFHFPLPQDASISGFGMWIGDELVMADVVEKQRAREIYEEIMRERRDPGLLEWTGGNIFKARVWPIFGHSEKRIKIVYTQVLPLKGNQYRYSYALQSEMLQQHPLKELAINVLVSSAIPLKSVTSPTHTVRSEKTESAARLEFAAQEHTPTRDFEVVVEVADAAAPVVVVPHRRGEDGYFLVQVTPPDPAAGERELLADGSPQRLVLVCDTSASMDPGQRANQAALASCLLGALTPKDTFNLGTSDVNVDWAFVGPQPATAESIAAAQTFLAGRGSLGWTDLDRAFEAALKQVGPRGQVVYLGDGIHTTGDANPQAFADRLRTMYQASGTSATLHAIALSSTFEPVVLKAIGGLGGGSVRRITNEQGPSAIAKELLDEMMRPPVRDLTVAFSGWKTARVYPEVLPNLVPGTQQILIGRYLPEGNGSSGEVIVSGQQNGQEVKYSAKATLKDADQGNSFLPRLWARMHLDKLLEQPQTDALKDEVIALSEEFGIITPYTSLLVLETDADRERFRVKRRFQMRDGERFFADAKQAAELDLARQQMKRAGDWRVGLRRTVLAQFATLGRNRHLLEGDERFGNQPGFAGRAGSAFHGRLIQGGGEDGLGGEYVESFGRLSRDKLGVWFGDSRSQDSLFDAELPTSGQLPRSETELPDGKPSGIELNDLDGDGLRKELRFERGLTDFREWDGTFADTSRLDSAIWDSQMGRGLYPEASRLASIAAQSSPQLYARMKRGGYRGPATTQWFEQLFPHLPEPTKPSAARPSSWPAEARELAQLVHHRDAVAKLSGLRVERISESLHRDGTPVHRNRTLELYSPTAWAIRTEYDTAQSHVEWCDGKERCAVQTGFRTGRVRTADASDLKQPSMSFFSQALEEAYVGLTAVVEKHEGNRAVLVLQNTPAKYEIRYTIDRAKKVILKVEHFQSGKISSTTTFSDFSEIGGFWWDRRSETTDTDGKRTGITSQSVVALPAGEFAVQVKALRAVRDSAFVLRTPAPSVAEARKALAADTATIDDRFTMLNFYAGYQQWAKAAEQLEALEKLAIKTPGVFWLRVVFLGASRRGEELRIRLLDEAERLLKLPASGDRLALADYVYRQADAQSVLAPNEQLELLDRLKPAYADLPGHSPARKNWQSHCISTLQQAGRTADALAQLKELAVESPREVYLQTNYAQALFAAGDRESAYGFLKKQLDLESVWSHSDLEQLRAVIANWLEGEGRLNELAEFLADWVKRTPESEDAHLRYLSTLIRTGKEEKAYELIAKWMKEAQAPDELSDAALVRFRAAARTATGRGHSLSASRIDPRWHPLLTETALALINHPKHDREVELIIGVGQFHQIDEASRVQTELINRLTNHALELPVDRLVRLTYLALSHAPLAGRPIWAALADDLRSRWKHEPDANRKLELGQVLARLLSEKLGSDSHRDFLRLMWKASPESSRAESASQLFASLLEAPWADEREAEAIALLPKLGESSDGDTRLAVQVAALHRLTDRMIQARTETLRKELANPEKMTRTELVTKRAELLTKARIALADRLVRAEPALPETLRQWAKAERLFLLINAGGDAKALASDVWSALGDTPKPSPWDMDTEPTSRQFLDELLTERFLTMALFFATQKGATPELVDRTLKYLDHGIAASPTQTVLKNAKVQLLVALDRPKELEAELGRWIKAGDADGRWRIAHGYVLAEQGRLKDAIAIFESIEKTCELNPAAYQALAGWYLAVNKQDGHERANLAAFKTAEENELARRLQLWLHPWQRGSGPVPRELSPDVPRLFAVLFEKSSFPQNYLPYLHQYYQGSRDFRLLSVMADAVIGQSAGKVYPFLGGMQPVMNEVRDESTADEILARIETSRQRGGTPTDLRALDLLEMQVRRRAAEQLNQPGPHAAMALAAMRRAFDRPWAEGERPMMSRLLRDLGTMTHRELADEQVRQVRELHGAERPGTPGRLEMAHDLGLVLGYYGRHREGVAVLQKALDETTAANAGILPVAANNVVNTLISFHERLEKPAEAEALLKDLLKKPANAEQQKWLSLRLGEVYHRALAAGRKVTLGSGNELYRALLQRLTEEVATLDPNHRSQLVDLLIQATRTARTKGLPKIDDDLRAFALKTLPPLLKTQPVNQNNVINTVAQALREQIGAIDAIAFLLDHIEAELKWFKLNNDDGWARHGGQLALWRAEVKALPPDLESRLLKLVLGELREDLRTRQQRNRSIYYANHGYYWKEMEEVFAATAEESYRRVKESGPGVAHVAGYLFDGCNRRARAIEVLLDAHNRKRLDDAAQVQLVSYLHRENRFAESLPLLVPLVERAPDLLHYRVLLVTAYAASGREAEARTAFAAAEAHFRHKERWGEPAMATLAGAAVDCKLFDRAVAIYGELIPHHQRTQPGRGVGNDVLARYHEHLARALSGLGKTTEAIDAASGAIVARGPDMARRAQGLTILREVLAEAPDLAKVVQGLDTQTAESGLLNPVVRSAIGWVYFDQGEFLHAITQLQVALAAQPNDAESLKLLIDCYDRLKNAEGAVGQVLRSLEWNQRDLKLFEDLGNRLVALGRGAEAERAYTSIVEVTPNEAEGHQRLAEIRQRQDRWPDAIRHWEQVARNRTQEPTGLIGLAKAQLHERKFEAAAETIRRLKARPWPQHFSDAPAQIAELEHKLRAAREK